MSSYEERSDRQAENIDMASRAMQAGIQKGYQGRSKPYNKKKDRNQVIAFCVISIVAVVTLCVFMVL